MFTRCHADTLSAMLLLILCLCLLIYMLEAKDMPSSFLLLLQNGAGACVRAKPLAILVIYREWVTSCHADYYATPLCRRYFADAFRADCCDECSPLCHVILRAVLIDFRAATRRLHYFFIIDYFFFARQFTRRR